MVLVNLFLAFFRIGLFAIGGAYSFLPFIEREVVQKYNWLTKEEFLDILGIVKVFPGAISVKFATYAGYKTAGISGAILANLGNILGPVILIIFTSRLYLKYKDLPSINGAFNMIQLVIFAMIVAVAFQLVNPNQLAQFKNVLIIIISFTIFSYTKIHPAFIIIAAGVWGAILK